MANLKLIKVTGRPFSDGSIDRIGIQRTNYQFDIIREKTLYSQDSSYGEGWTYATAEEIAENWKLIYPHWTPEVGDRVIITQDFQDWANSRGTIVEKDGSSDYYRVESETGRSCIFDYTSQMILAPTTSTTSTTTVTETKSESPIGWQWQDLKVGDKVKIIGGDYSSRPVGSIFTIDKMENKDYGGKHPIKLIGSDGSDKGWPYKEHFEPYYGDVKKPKLQSKYGFTLGDRVLCVETSGPRANKTGTVVHFDGGSVGVAYDDYSSGHECNGHCPDRKGWYSQPEFIKHYTEPTKESKAKEETVIVRFLTEQEFKYEDLWKETHPKGWNNDGEMNKYLGQSVVILKSSIRSDGAFKYEDWTFSRNDYLITEGVSSSKSISTPVVDTKPEKRSLKIGDAVIANCGPFNNVLGKIKEIRDSRFGVEFCERRLEGHHLSLRCETGCGWYYAEHELILVDDSIRRLKSERPLRRFKVGDKVTYKSLAQCGGDYRYGGNDQGGFVGTVESESEYDSDKGCYGLRVSCRDGFYFNMLESEFCEYDGTTIDKTLHIHKITTDSFTIQDVIDGTVGTTLTYGITPTFSGHVDPLSSYKQKPITIKQKPKSKLTII